MSASASPSAARVRGVWAPPVSASAPPHRRRSSELSILAFSLLALLAAVRFASLLAHPSLLRVAGIVLLGAALGAGLGASASLPRSAASAALRALASLLALYIALRFAGLAARELWPWRWGSLARELGRGAEALNGLWPYEGSSTQAPVAICACIACAVLPAAVLVFWPSRRHVTGRRFTALALLLGLYVTAASNQSRAEWALQGLVLLAALYCWAWAMRERRTEDPRAAAWMLAGGVVAVVAAVAVAGGGPLLPINSWNPFGAPPTPTSFEWNQTYGPLSWSTSPETMVDVASAKPQLWRAAILSAFNGVGFVRSSDSPPEVAGIDGEGGLRWVTTSTFTVRGLDSRDVLSPGEILSVGLRGNALPSLQTIATDGTQELSAPPQAGVRYTVAAYAPHPTPAEMRVAPAGIPADYAPYIEFDLPSRSGSPRAASAVTPQGVAAINASPYAGVYALARRIAGGAQDTYDVVSHTESFLHSGFTYNTNPPRERYPLVSFLLKNRIGYCQQFSGAMTLMLRMDGIPARVAAGFLPGTRGSAGQLSVSARDAHAWVEVFFAGIGWVTFDPTPPARVGSDPILGGHRSLLSAGEFAAATRSRPQSAASQAPARVLTSGAARSSGSWAGWLAAGAAVVLAALLGAAWWAGWRLRRPAAQSEADPDLAELLRALAALGLSLAPGSTLSELQAVLARSSGPGAAGYVARLRERLYSPRPTAARPSARERRMLRRELTAGRGMRTRIRVLMVLAPRLSPRRRLPRGLTPEGP